MECKASSMRYQIESQQLLLEQLVLLLLSIQYAQLEMSPLMDSKACSTLCQIAFLWEEEQVASLQTNSQPLLTSLLAPLESLLKDSKARPMLSLTQSQTPFP